MRPWGPPLCQVPPASASGPAHRLGRGAPGAFQVHQEGMWPAERSGQWPATVLPAHSVPSKARPLPAPLLLPGPGRSHGLRGRGRGEEFGSSKRRTAHSLLSRRPRGPSPTLPLPWQPALCRRLELTPAQFAGGLLRLLAPAWGSVGLRGQQRAAAGQPLGGWGSETWLEVDPPHFRVSTSSLKSGGWNPAGSGRRGTATSGTSTRGHVVCPSLQPVWPSPCWGFVFGGAGGTACPGHPQPSAWGAASPAAPRGTRQAWPQEAPHPLAHSFTHLSTHSFNAGAKEGGRE